MKFILPTQNAPKTETQVGDLKISPHKRVKIESGGMIMYWDSMMVEFSGENWKTINEWIIFHNIIFNDHISLDWYESQNFDTDKLIEEGDCAYLVDYSNITNKIHFPNTYSKVLIYEDLYKKYILQPEENKSLVKNYFNSTGVVQVKSLNRQIRDNSFWRILVLFSITESIVGDIPKCSEDMTCSIHGKLNPHNNILTKEWIKHRLAEIISDSERVDEYFSVIWEVRQKIRHRTVHEGFIPDSHNILQNEREIVWDWTKTTQEWKRDTTALHNLENHMRDITRNLLLNRLFGLEFFPSLRPLHSVRILSK